MRRTCDKAAGHHSGVFRGVSWLHGLVYFGPPLLPGNNMITWKFDVAYSSMARIQDFLKGGDGQGGGR